MKKKIIPLMFACVGLLAHAQTPDVKFFNTGKVSVKKDGLIFVKGAFAAKETASNSVNVKLDGKLVQEGDFYYNPNGNTGHVFDAASTGTFVFTGATTAPRLIKIDPSTDVPDTYDRANNYIAFPNVKLAGKVSVLEIPAKMGIDIDTLFLTDTTQNAKLLLKSKTIGTKVYNASVRFASKHTNYTGVSADYVPAGAVIVEQNVGAYRPSALIYDGLSSEATVSLFGFAPPFEQMYSGYFAGNYVRQFLIDNATTHSVTYYNADKPKETGSPMISVEQYVNNATARLTAGNPYLLQLRPSNFDYSGLSNDSTWMSIETTNNAAFTTDKYIFNGLPGNGAFASLFPVAENEQLFAKDVLFTFDLPKSMAYANWVIGNSWTAPISIEALKTLMSSSALQFNEYLYLWPAGKTSYQTVQMSTGGAGTMDLSTIKVIPSQSFFRLSVRNRTANPVKFTITKDVLLHDAVHHGMQAAPQIHDNEMVLRVSTTGNSNIYDMAGIGLRADGVANSDANDIAKTTTQGVAFYLYSLSADNKALEVNMMPYATDSVLLNFYTGQTDEYMLEVSRLESMNQGDGVWLEDLKTGSMTDLLATDGTYTFSSEAGDSPERFVVHFNEPQFVPTGWDYTDALSKLKLYYSQRAVFVSGLNEQDLGSTMTICDVQGKLIYQNMVTSIEAQKINVSDYASGVYIISLKGNRNEVLKFIIK